MLLSILLTPSHWLALGLFLLIAELLLNGGFLLWIGIAAITLSVTTWLIPTLNWGTQLFFFSFSSILTSFLWWAYLQRHPIATDDPKLNRRNEQYVGLTFVLVEAITNGHGKIRIGDTLWSVKGADAPAGAKVKIVRAEGTTLFSEEIK